MTYDKLLAIFLQMAKDDLLLTKESQRVLNNFIKKNPYEILDQSIINYCFKNYLLGNLELDYYSTKVLLEEMTINLAKKYNINVVCHVLPYLDLDKDGNERCLGRIDTDSKPFQIELSKVLIDYFLHSQNRWYEAFVTIFHEIEHVKQFNQMQKIPNFDDYEALKDELIKNKRYKDLNYDDLNYESVARIRSVSKTIDYVDYLEIKMNNKDKKYYFKQIIFDRLFHYRNHQRIFIKDFVSVDILFDEKIKDLIINSKEKDCFSKYPILKEFYYPDGTKKTLLELLYRMDELDPDSKLYTLIESVIINCDSTLENSLKELEELINSDYNWENKKDIIKCLFNRTIRHFLRTADNVIMNTEIAKRIGMIIVKIDNQYNEYKKRKKEIAK